MKNRTKNADPPKSSVEVMDKRLVKTSELPVKVYEARPSVLTDLWQNANILTVYNIFVAVFVGLSLNTIIHDYVHKERLNIGLRLIKSSFVQLHTAILIWICIFLSNLSIYFCFKIWASSRLLRVSSIIIRIWNWMCLMIFLLYFPGLLYFSTRISLQYRLGIANKFAVTMEATRFIMKTYSFIRSNVPRVFQYKPNIKGKRLCPSFSQYLYFLFAPTLIYQESYPRSTVKTNWSYVFKSFLEIGLSMLFISCVFERSFIYHLQDYGLKPYPWQKIMVIVFECTNYALLIAFTVFYAGLHVWQNAFAEMLGFSDRLFYKDWWTSTTFQRYYRTWNVIVHDWLYTYIYKEFYENFVPSKLLGRCMVFLVSALFHEYIFAVAFGFFLPIVSIQIVITVVIIELLRFKNQTIGNVTFWCFIACGLSLNCTLYTIEYYARVNCPTSEISAYDFFIPRLLNCNK